MGKKQQSKRWRGIKRYSYPAAQRMVQYGVMPPEPPIEAYVCPPPLVQSDERRCVRCGMIWGLDEDKPPCPNGL